MCGVFGIFGHEDGKALVPRLAEAMQHRGQNAFGMAALDPDSRYIHIIKGKGSVVDVLDDNEYSDLVGKAFIGHVRWPTQGSNDRKSVQPHFTMGTLGQITLVFNGDIINLKEIQAILKKAGIRIYTDNDAELMTGLIYYFLVKKKMTLMQAIVASMEKLRGAYSALLLADWDDALYAFRDPSGFRPLLLGDRKNRYIIASETCQFDEQGVEATYLREIDPGELVRVSDEGLQSIKAVEQLPRTSCSVEHAYFQMPTSKVHYYREDDSIGVTSNYLIRRELGAQCAREFPVPNADMVLSVPKSGIPAGIGFSHESGIPYEFGLFTRGGRTFTEAEEEVRRRKAIEKYLYDEELVRGKIIVVVDDSSIKALTAETLTKKAFEAGVKEIHFRSAAPRYIYKCHMGMETKKQYQLFASDKTPEQQRRAAGGPTSLEFISMEGYAAVMRPYRLSLSLHLKNHRCFACFDGNYPVPLETTQAAKSAE